MKLSRVKEALVKETIKTLDYGQKKEFGFFCLDRIIDLYKDVDSRIDISEANSNIENGTAYDTLISIYKDLKHNISMELSEIQSKIFDSLILDTEEIFDNSVENTVAGVVAENLYYLLKFKVKEDDQCIFDCSRNNIAIISQIMSEYFFENISKDENVCDDLLEFLFVEEYNTQLKAINLIKEHRKNALSELIKETIIHNKNID